jgi:hypothetical protein
VFIIAPTATSGGEDKLHEVGITESEGDIHDLYDMSDYDCDDEAFDNLQDALKYVKEKYGLERHEIQVI